MPPPPPPPFPMKTNFLGGRKDTWGNLGKLEEIWGNSGISRIMNNVSQGSTTLKKTRKG